MSLLEPNECILCDGTGKRRGVECQNCDGDGQRPPRFKKAEVREGQPVLPMNTENLADTPWVTHYTTPKEAVALGESLIEAAQEAARQEFIHAAENDEYAEVGIGDDYVLITDVEGDGTFMPYVHPPEDDDGDSEQHVDDLLADLDGLTVSYVEWDENNGVYHTSMSVR